MTLNYFLYTYIQIPFFGEQPTGQTLRPILTRDNSKDAKLRKNVTFWSYKK